MNDQPVWWRETAIYQIYPRSFADSNDDGIGDLPGIIDRLDYIQDLGFETIWLSPHYASPQRDFGYDVADYHAVAPEYGTLADAERLIEAVHGRGMKIIFDMILNHTSDQHPWFLESRSSRDNPRRDWYIWRDGRGRRPPNNWRAIPGGSGWEYDEGTDQWYFHNFLPFQPDLNFRNPDVKAAMFDTMRFWLDRGVDGFRLDIFHSIYKDEHFRDNPFSWRLLPTSDFDAAFFQELRFNLNRPETFALAQEVRALIDTYQPARFVVGEVFGKDVVKKYLGENHDGLNLILLFDLAEMSQVTAANLSAILQTYEAEYPHPYTPTYALGNHDRRRFISRIGENWPLAKLLTFFLYTARGVPLNYYGDEIGIPDGHFPHKDALDGVAHAYWWLPQPVAQRLGLYINRDGCRTPMQWTAEANGGFCPAGVQPWLPVHPSYPSVNVDAQRQAEFSLLNTTRKLLQLRREHACMRRGALAQWPADRLPADVVGYDRVLGQEKVSVLLNVSSTPQNIALGSEPQQVLASSDKETAVEGSDAKLGPYGCLVWVR